MKTSLVLLLGSVVVACGGAPAAPTAPIATATVSATPAPPPPPPPPAGAYPLAVPVIDNAELDRREAAEKAKTPEWQIVLDPYGYLSSATCRDCTDARETFSADDVARVEAFFAKHEEIVQMKAPGVRAKAPLVAGTRRAFYQQWAGDLVLTFSDVEKSKSSLRIGGHHWPSLPAEGARQPQATLAAKLKAIDPSPELTVVDRFSPTAKTLAGPLEIRDSSCLQSPDDRKPNSKHPTRPCVDARTGEDISALLVASTVQTKDGKTTKRELFRQH